MKKLLSVLSIMFILTSIVFAGVTDTGSAGLNVGTKAQRSASGFTVGVGDILVCDELMSKNGFVVVTDVFDDVPASNETGHFNTSISTTILRAGTTIFTGALITQPIIPMNVVVISSATSIAQDSWDYGATLTIVGYDARGEAQTENIKITNASIAGVKAWSYFTSYSINTSTGGTAAANAIVRVGVGTILGLSNHIETAGLVSAGGDVIWAQLDDSGTTATDSPTVSATYNTWTPDTVGDGTSDVYTIRYKVKKR